MKINSYNYFSTLVIELQIGGVCETLVVEMQREPYIIISPIIYEDAAEVIRQAKNG